MSAPAGGPIMSSTGKATSFWSFRYIGEDYSQHHDFCVMPNGNLLLVAWEYKNPQEVLWPAARRPLSRPRACLSITSSKSRKPGPIPGRSSGNGMPGTISCRTKPALPNYGQASSRPERINVNAVGALVKDTGKIDLDWTHVNGIDYNAQTDQIMLSVHTQSEVWIIDHGTTTAEAAGSTGGKAGHGGDLLYRFGNPQTYDAGTAADQTLHGQHDAQWIADGLPGAGNALVFDNGAGKALTASIPMSWSWPCPWTRTAHIAEIPTGPLPRPKWSGAIPTAMRPAFIRLTFPAPSGWKTATPW